MFERFSERARQVVVLAQDEARALRHNYIGTEHILLGLLREEEGPARHVLESLGITRDGARVKVAGIVGEGEEVTTGQIPFTPRAKKVLELSLREALSLGDNYIGTEHVLLGLVRENEGVGARILLDSGAGAEQIRSEILRVLSAPPPEVGERIAEARRRREAALEADDPELAAAWQARERELEHPGARWHAGRGAQRRTPRPRRLWQVPRRARDYAAPSWRAPLLLGWAMFGAAAALGLGAGWLIWG